MLRYLWGCLKQRKKTETSRNTCEGMLTQPLANSLSVEEEQSCPKVSPALCQPVLGTPVQNLWLFLGRKRGRHFLQKHIPRCVPRNAVGSNADRSMSHVPHVRCGARKWAVKYSCWSVSHQLHASGQSNPA